jgi:hypothetical protein
MHSSIDRSDEYTAKTFTQDVPGITLEELKAYSKSIRLASHEDFKVGNKYYIPGNLIEGLFRDIIKKLGNTNKEFPVNFLESFKGGNGGTHENRIYTGDELTCTCQIKTTPTDVGPLIQFLGVMEFTRGNKIVFSGIYNFIGENRKND